MKMKIFGILGALLAVGVVASASPAACGTSPVTLVSANVDNGDLFSDINAFGGTDACTAYGLTFSNFSVYTNAGFPTDPTTIPFSMTVTFQSNGSVVFGSSLVTGEDINLQYEITSGIAAEILSSGGSTGTGVTENVCSTQQTIPGGTCSGTVLGSGSVTGANTVVISIAANSSDWIFKDVSGTSAFSETVVPEPMTLSLMGVGLLGLGLLRKRIGRG